jgi:hypothetical protein
MIEDLAVEDDYMPAVGTEDRLVAALDIDNAEPAHPKTEIAVREIACVVRAAVAELVARGH